MAGVIAMVLIAGVLVMWWMATRADREMRADLPITFIIEDNGLSVRTDTRNSWGCDKCNFWDKEFISDKCKRYKYIV